MKMATAYAPALTRSRVPASYGIESENGASLVHAFLSPRTKKYSVAPENAYSTVIEYIRTHGHHQDGIFYFPQSWMNANFRRLLENQGMISKAGSQRYLRRWGVEIESERHGGAIYFKIDRTMLKRLRRFSRQVVSLNEYKAKRQK